MNTADWISAIAAIGSCAAALFAWQSSRTSHRVAEVQLLHSFLTDYSSERMRDSLRTLRNWHALHGSSFAERWIIAFAAGDRAALEVDSARRLVHYYYVNAYKLHAAGYCSSSFLKAVTDNAGYSIFAEIVTHLDLANDPNTNVDPHRHLHAIFQSKARHFVPPRPTRQDASTHAK